MDSLTAARLQMALSLAFHMIFAAVGIGLPLLLVIVEGLWLRTGKPHYRDLAQKWAKATGILFAVGAVSGTALAFELGLLWPKYMELTGAVVGHIFGLEGYAFFAEAIFIGLYLYGWDKLSPRAHWLCGVMIAVSGALSGILVVGVNAWMQLPIGFTLENGRVEVSDPIAIFKQPAWAYMAIHSTLSCFIAVAFAVAALYARSRLKGDRSDYSRSAIVVALAVGAISMVLQMASGDLLAKFVFQTQKAKFAAMEAQFKTERYAPVRIGGIADEEAETTRYAIEIPGALSFLATHDPAAEVPGLSSIPRENWPPVDLVHLSFDVMVGAGTVLLLVSLWFWFAYWRGAERALSNRRLLWAIALCGPLGFLALEAGWMVTELGRQPWIIHGIMRVEDAVTPAGDVQAVFWGFAALYALLGTTVATLLWRLRSNPTKPAAGEGSA